MAGTKQTVNELVIGVNVKGANTAINAFTKVRNEAIALQNTIGKNSGLKQFGKEADRILRGIQNDLASMADIIQFDDKGRFNLIDESSVSSLTTLIAKTERYKSQVMGLSKVAIPNFAEKQETDFNKLILLMDKLDKSTSKVNRGGTAYKDLKTQLESVGDSILNDVNYNDKLTSSMSKLRGEVSLLTARYKEKNTVLSQRTDLGAIQSQMKQFNAETQKSPEFQKLDTKLKKYIDTLVKSKRPLEDFTKGSSAMRKALAALEVQQTKSNKANAEMKKQISTLNELKDKFNALDKSVQSGSSFSGALIKISTSLNEIKRTGKPLSSLTTDIKGLNSAYVTLNKQAVKNATVQARIPASINKQQRALESLTYKVDNFTTSMERSIQSKTRWASSKALNAANKEVAALKKLQSALDKAKVKMDAIPKSAAGYEAAKKRVDNLTNAFNKMHHTASKTKAALNTMDPSKWLVEISKRATAYAGIYGGIFGVIQALKSGVGYMIEFDKAVKTMSAVLDVSTVKAQGLENQLINLGIAFGGELEDINKAALALGRAGIAFEQVAEATEIVMKMSMLTGDSIEQSASAIISYSQVYGDIPLEELGDKLAYVANASRLSTQDINTFSNYALASAKAVGFSIDAIDGMAIAFSNAGFNASTIGTQIRKFTTLLNDSSSDVQDFFNQMGLSQSAMRDMVAGGEDMEAMDIFLQRIAEVDVASFNKSISGMDLLVKNVLNAMKNNAQEVMDGMHKSTSGVTGELEKAVIVSQSYVNVWQSFKNELGSIAAASDSAFGSMLINIQQVTLGLKSMFNYLTFDSVESEVGNVKLYLIGLVQDLKDAEEAGSTARVQQIKQEMVAVNSLLREKQMNLLLNHQLEDSAKALGHELEKAYTFSGEAAYSDISKRTGFLKDLADDVDTLKNGTRMAELAMGKLSQGYTQEAEIIRRTSELTGASYKDFVKTLMNSGEKGANALKTLGIDVDKVFKKIKSKDSGTEAFAAFTKDIEEAVKETLDLGNALAKLDQLDLSTFFTLGDKISTSFRESLKSLPDIYKHSIQVITDSAAKLEAEKLIPKIEDGDLNSIIQAQIEVERTAKSGENNSLAFKKLNGILKQYIKSVVKIRGENSKATETLNKQHDAAKKLADRVRDINNAYKERESDTAHVEAMIKVSQKLNDVIVTPYEEASISIDSYKSKITNLETKMYELGRLDYSVIPNAKKNKDDIKAIVLEIQKLQDQIKLSEAEQSVYLVDTRRSLSRELANMRGEDLVGLEEDLKRRIAAIDASAMDEMAKIELISMEKERFGLKELDLEERLNLQRIESTKVLNAMYAFDNPLDRAGKLRDEISVEREHLAILRAKQEELEKLGRAHEAVDTKILQTQLNIMQLSDALMVAGDNAYAGLMRGIRNYAESFESSFQQMEKFTEETAKAMESAMGDIFFDAMKGELKSAEDYWKSFSQAVMQMLAQMLAKQMLIKGFQYLTLLAAADGAVVSNGNITGAAARRGVTAYANGGIVGGPTIFQTKKDQVGLMGEEGPEAIMPLTRLNGVLGVKADMSNVRPDAQQNIMVTMNISAMDSKSFGQQIAENKAVVADVVRQAINDNNAVRRAR